MSQEEASGSKPEKYLGDEIEVRIEGGKLILRTVVIQLKNHEHITIRAQLDSSIYGIRPVMAASRGMWAKGPPFKPKSSR